MAKETSPGKYGFRRVTASRVVHALHPSWEALVKEVEASTTDAMLADAPRSLQCNGQTDLHELIRRRRQILKQELPEELGALSLMLVEDSQTGEVEESLVYSVNLRSIG